MSTEPAGPGPDLPAGRWPSTWPALWRPVRDRAVLAGATVLLTLIGIGWLGDLGLSWWVPLLPLLLLIGPLSRPGRVRRRFERAATRGRLVVAPHRSGWQLQPAAGRRDVLAVVGYDGGLRYIDLRGTRR